MPQTRPLRIGWFTAGRGSGSRGMFERTLRSIDEGSLNAQIEFVFMHRERGEGEGSDAFMDLADDRGIPVITLSSVRFRRERGGTFADHREAYDAEVLKLLSAYRPDVCMLAGYLLIMGPELVNAFPCVNLHPALPGGPTGLWQKVVWELIDQRARQSGLMTFLVTDELDKGPPMTYARFPLRGPRFDPLWESIQEKTAEELKAEAGENHPLFTLIRAEGLRREPILVVETLKALASGKIVISGRQVTDTKGNPIAPRDLSGQVNAAISA